jgi:hypothetical protein
MKRLALILVAALLAAVFILPAQADECAPPSLASIRTGHVAAPTPGLWAYWYCNEVDEALVQPNWRAIPDGSVNTTLLGSARSYATGTNPNFVKQKPTLTEKDPKIAPLYAAMQAAAIAERAAVLRTAAKIRAGNPIP